MKNLPIWIVLHVEPMPDYKLLINFADGSKRIFDCKPLLDRKIFEQLKNPSIFSKAKVECGTVVWSDELDISPEYLYEKSEIVESENYI